MQPHPKGSLDFALVSWELLSQPLGGFLWERVTKGVKGWHWEKCYCLGEDLGQPDRCVLFMGFSRQEYWSGLPFPSPVDHILSDLFTMTRPSWVAPRAQLSFIELDKAVVHVIRLASCLWLWFQCVCPLMPSLSTCCLIGVSLTLDMGYLFTAAPYFGRGVSSHSLCSWPWTWGIFSQLHAIPAPCSHCPALRTPHFHISGPGFNP